MIGTPPSCTGWASPGLAPHRVCRPGVLEGGPLGCGPHSGDDGKLLLQPVEALAHAREGDAVGRVLRLEPAGTEPELDPATAHLVDAGDGDRERAGEPERRRRHERAEADAAGVACQAGEGGPGVGRAGGAVARHVQVVVGAEERVEAEVLGGAGDREEVVVGRALLRLGEDAEVHASNARRPGASGSRRVRRRGPGARHRP